MFPIALEHQLRRPPNVDIRYPAVKAAPSAVVGSLRKSGKS
jgi:hypothetical protein